MKWESEIKNCPECRMGVEKVLSDVGPVWRMELMKRQLRIWAITAAFVR
jgi:hypothetical protein